MEEDIGRLKNFISTYEKGRLPVANSPGVGKKSANTVKNKMGVIESLAALSLGGRTPVDGPTSTPTKPAPANKPKKSKKRFIRVPNKCVEKFTIDDFNTNNYKAIETVINGILSTRKSKAAAKKSKAKTDIRLKTLGTPLEPHRINNPLEDNKKIQDMKPQSAQPRTYRYYYKKVNDDKNQFQTKLVPRSLNDLNQIYEETAKNLQNFNRKKAAIREKVLADILLNKNIGKL